MNRFAILATAAAAAALTAAAWPQSPHRLDGEYGLMVREHGDSVYVHWITRSAGTGYLRAFDDGRELPVSIDDAAFAHRGAFARPKAIQVRIDFGSAADSTDRATTRIYFDTLPRTTAVSGVDSIFVLGDTHGEFDRVTQILRSARLIDDSLRWTGSRAHLVFDGDMMDRGSDVTRLLWFVYGLERQALAAGGRVHVLLGNHETMVMLNDLRYTAPKELYIAQLHGVGYSKMFDTREAVLGRWLASKQGILRVDDVLFAHGGVSTDFLGYTLQSFDDSLHTFIGEDLFYRWSDSTAIITIERSALERRENFFLGENSVFWFRGYARSDTLDAELTKVLRRFGAGLHVIGHTPAQAIHQRYDARVINAHPREFATEMLLLVRGGKDWKRLRLDLQGRVTALQRAEND